ncbi:MAG TPA: hypothetical protein VLG71_02625, partial [Candidatus Limnocylindria bacterium]|nr:hypothetical protein [Candidatus Limnocylindria bacterium]
AGANPYIRDEQGNTFLAYLPTTPTGQLRPEGEHILKIWESYLARGSKAAAQHAPEPSRPSSSSETGPMRSPGR